MGVANKAEITREMLIEYITHYQEWKQEVVHYREQMAKVRPAASTARYGIEASMPRGGGSGHSDPTFAQATSTQVEPYITRRVAAIRVIDNRRRIIRSVRENDVLDMWVKGLTITETADMLSIGKSTVQRCREKILDLMMEGK